MEYTYAPIAVACGDGFSLSLFYSLHIWAAIYLYASIPFGIIFAYLSGYGDIRQIGSGNIGATNVLRTGNKKIAFLTLLFDGTKGVIFPAFICLLDYYDTHFNNGSDKCPILGAMPPFELLFLFTVFISILGHCFPIWLKFKGGKGVATALGGLLAAVPYAGLAACLTWLITAKVTKISSLSALVALAVAPVVTFFIYGSSSAFICALITLLVWWRHKDNIKRLMNGTELKIGQKKKDADAPPVSE